MSNCAGVYTKILSLLTLLLYKVIDQAILRKAHGLMLSLLCLIAHSSRTFTFFHQTSAWHAKRFNTVGILCWTINTDVCGFCVFLYYIYLLWKSLVNKYKTKQNEIILAIQHKYVFSLCLHTTISTFSVMLERHRTSAYGLHVLVSQKLIKLAEINLPIYLK